MGDEMVQQSFHDRIERINRNSGQAQMLAGTMDTGGGHVHPAGTGQTTKRPGFLKLVGVAALMVPVGMAIALLTKVFLDPEITPEAVHYLPLLVLVAGSNLLLAGGAIGAVMARFRLSTLNYALLFAFAGYGLASATLAAMLP